MVAIKTKEYWLTLLAYIHMRGRSGFKFARKCGKILHENTGPVGDMKI